MYFVVLAADYDGTLAVDGRVSPETIAALERVKASGRKLVLVTGRELPEVKAAMPELEIFDLAVVENGALLYRPSTQEETLLTAPPPPSLLERLKAEKVQPLSVGRVIIATVVPNETVLLSAVRDLSLEHQIIFNKGAVMLLPPNVNKASGLKEALERLGVSLHNVVGIGDAENDTAFLMSCGCAVAVGNAIEPLKQQADLVVGPCQRGAIELAEMLVSSDLKSLGDRLPRTRVDAGTRQDGSIVHITPFETILITGESGAGKSTTVSALLERMRDEDYQFCVIDPEGDYSELEETVPVGDPKHEPNIEQVISLLEKPNVSTIVNLLAISPSERPAFFANFMAELSKFRAKTGRPHWLIVDEAHHCIPVEWQAAALTLPQDMPATIAVTVHPESVAMPFLELVTTVIGVGKGAEKVIGKFCEVTGRRPSIRGAPADFQATGHVLAGDTLEPVVLNRPAAQRKRHVRKYAEGELGKDKSFYFRGPADALNLRAQNLMVFLQLAEGVDDETWLHHLRQGDYSCWLKAAIKDPELADLVMAVEENDGFSARDSRKEIKAVIERKYTAPAKSA